jgi:hypothetical protein
MCGIAGFTHRGGTSSRIIRRSMQTLGHRGPDEQRVFESGNISIGAVRLKIIAHVFISDSDLRQLWGGNERYYLLAETSAVQRFVGLLGADHLHVIAESGGKCLLANFQQEAPEK